MTDSTGNGDAPPAGTNGTTPAAGSAEDIFTHAQALAFKDVPVPEWGYTVRVQELDTGAREEFENEVAKESPDGQETPSLRAYFLQRCLRSPKTGALLFAETDQKTGKVTFPERFRTAIARMPATPVVRLFALGRSISKMLPEDTEAVAAEIKKLRSGATSSA